MAPSSDDNNGTSILFFKSGTFLHVQIRDETEPIPFTDFVEIELMADLRLNYVRSKLGTLVDCPCFIPRLDRSATSVNHAYTIISEHFEIRRLAKGGNVFRKVYYEDRTGSRVALGKKRDLAIAEQDRQTHKHAAAQVPIGEPAATPPFYHEALSLLLNDLLYDELLFAELSGSTVEKCRKAIKKSGTSYDRDPGRLFPFYHHVFGIFRCALDSMAVGDLMGRWSDNVRPFMRGTWTGFYQNEVEWLIGNAPAFAPMILELIDSRGTAGDRAKLDVWIKLRTDKDTRSNLTEDFDAEPESRVDDTRPRYDFSVSEQKLAEMAEFDLAYSRNEWHLDPPEACDYCSRQLAECRFFVDGKEKATSMWGNMCPNCFILKGEGIRWGTGQLYMKVSSNRWLMVGGFRLEEL